MFTLPQTEEQEIRSVLTGIVAVWEGRWDEPLSVPRVVVSRGRSRRGTGTRYTIHGLRAHVEIDGRAPSQKCASDEAAAAWANRWAEKHGLASLSLF